MESRRAHSKVARLHRAPDAEFADAGLQGSAFHAEKIGGAARAGDAPFGLPKSAQDMLPLRFFQCGYRSAR